MFGSLQHNEIKQSSPQRLTIRFLLAHMRVIGGSRLFNISFDKCYYQLYHGIDRVQFTQEYAELCAPVLVVDATKGHARTDKTSPVSRHIGRIGKLNGIHR